MKTASVDLANLINGSKEFCIADLLTVVTPAATFRWTSADLNITHGGNTFVVFPFERGSTRTMIGTEVDTFDLTLFVNEQSLIGGIPVSHFASNGGFDGAAITLERAFLASWGVLPTGALRMFSGRVSEVVPSRTEVAITVKSDMELLNIRMPRNVYQAGCPNTLFDSGCGLNKASFAVNSACLSGSSKTSISSALAQSAGFFDLGTITFTSGPNAGVTRTVKSYASGSFKLSLPLPYAPTTGDTFTAYPGCDRTQATCEIKFNNKGNFRGLPYIPVPETGI